jgi:hypothetical protein
VDQRVEHADGSAARAELLDDRNAEIAGSA